MQMRFVSGLFLLPFANPVVRRRYFQLSFSYLGRAKRSCRISPEPHNADGINAHLRARKPFTKHGEETDNCIAWGKGLSAEFY